MKSTFRMADIITRIGPFDIKLIRRDRFLLLMFLFAFYIALALRFLLPWADTYLAAKGLLPNKTVSFALHDTYPMIVAYLVFYTGALLVGTIFGFMLIDEKDDRTLSALLVSPLPLKKYVGYRIGVAALLAFIIILGMTYLVNQALLPLWQMLLLTAGASLAAPIITLFFAVFAENKVQGFAYSKFGGISGWVFLVGYFIPEPWQWLFGFYPPYWIGKAYWMALAGNPWWWIVYLTGVGLNLAWIAWFVAKFNRAAYRTC